MEFNMNHPILFLLAGIVILAVLGQSTFFLVRAWKRGLEIGMDRERIKKIAVTAGIFTIAPAIAIVISVITLSQSLGVALPWLRLSVVGSLSYETVAASNAMSGMGLKLGAGEALNASQYVTVAMVMTCCVLVGIWLVPLIAKKYLSGMSNLEKRDKAWSDILSNALFIGMISAFLGYVFCDVSLITTGDASGFIPVCVFFVSALVMVVCGSLVKKVKARWISDYALPLSLIIGMAAAIPLTAWLG